jgi:flagellar biosynthetic protein FliR
MPWLEPYLLNQTAAFVLILARVGALLTTAPLFGAQSAPIRVRALLAFALSLLVLPLHADPGTGSLLTASMNVLSFGQLVAMEVVVGAMLGLGVMVLISGVQMAGQVVAQMSGMAIGELFDPSFDTSVSVFGQVFYYVTIALFVAIGGHTMAIEALLNTFAWAPPGQAALSGDYADLMIGLLGQSFELALRAAAPLMIALLLSTIVLGLISRTMPQINVIVVGFSANALLTLGLCFFCIGGVAWVFQQPLQDALTTLSQSVTTAELAQPVPLNPGS